jgi:hypothetical protein
MAGGKQSGDQLLMGGEQRGPHTLAGGEQRGKHLFRTRIKMSC